MEEKIKIDDVSWVHGFNVSYYDGGDGNMEEQSPYWPKPDITDGVVRLLDFSYASDTYVLVSDIIGVRVLEYSRRNGDRVVLGVVMEALLSGGQQIACGSEDCFESLVNGLLAGSIHFNVPKKDGWPSAEGEQELLCRAEEAQEFLKDEVFTPYAAAVLKAAQEARR